MAPAPYLVTRRWIKERYQRWGPNHPMYRARALGEFPEQSEMSVYSLGWIERASREPDLVSRAEQRSYPGSASMWPDPARMKPRSWRRSAERSSRSSHGLCLIHREKNWPGPFVPSTPKHRMALLQRDRVSLAIMRGKRRTEINLSMCSPGDPDNPCESYKRASRFVGQFVRLS